MLSSCLLGCAAQPPPEPAPTEPTTGGAQPSVAESEPESEPEPEPEPEPPPATGPALVTVTALVKGEPVAANVKLVAMDDSVAAEGPAGTQMRVESGQYDMEVQVTDGAVLVDKPTRRQSLVLAAGAEAAESVEFPWAKVQLNVRVNGNPDKNAVVRLMRGGQQVAELKSGAAHVGISPGRYEAKVKTKGAVIEVPQLMFPEGATQGVPVNVSF